MKLTVRDASRFLNVSEREIYRWIKQDALPAYQVNDEYRFNRAELLEWATARKISCSPEIFSESQSESAVPKLSEALEAGGVHYGVGGNDKAAVLHAVVDLMELTEGIDRDFLFQVLLAREALGSTGIGQGIAIPHVRNPILLQGSKPMVMLCFLRQAVAFGALDGQPVSILFTLISPTVRIHLHLLSRLGYALRDPKFKDAVMHQQPRNEIFQVLRQVETAMIPGSAARPLTHGTQGNSD